MSLTKEAVVDRRDEAGHDEDDDARIVQPPYRLQQAAVGTATGRPSSSKAVTCAAQLQLATTTAASVMVGLPLIWEVLHTGCSRAGQLPTCHPWRLADDPVTLFCSQDPRYTAAVKQRLGVGMAEQVTR